MIRVQSHQVSDGGVVGTCTLCFKKFFYCSRLGCSQNTPIMLCFATYYAILIWFACSTHSRNLSNVEYVKHTSTSSSWERYLSTSSALLYRMEKTRLIWQKTIAQGCTIHVGFSLLANTCYTCMVNVGVHVVWWQLRLHMCGNFTDYAQNYVYAFNHLKLYWHNVHVPME